MTDQGKRGNAPTRDCTHTRVSKTKLTAHERVSPIVLHVSSLCHRCAILVSFPVPLIVGNLSDTRACNMSSVPFINGRTVVVYERRIINWILHYPQQLKSNECIKGRRKVSEKKLLTLEPPYIFKYKP